MPGTQLTGTRIRDRRLDRGMRQADLARAVGISAAYLNLIEHNRRRIGGRLLQDIARTLGVEAAALSEGAEGMLVAALQAAAAETPGAGAETARAEEFAGRLPGWAVLVAEQSRRIAMLEARLQVLADRLTHDTDLAAALHRVISAVTSIRSTSSILVGGEDLDRDWTARFHRNIHEDAVKLAESSTALVRYLEGSGDEGAIRSAQEEVERFLDLHDHHFPELEAGDAGAVAAIAARMRGEGASEAAAQLLEGWLVRYAADARLLPPAPFAAAAREAGYDPAALARRFGTGLAPVLRRLAALPPGRGHPPAGLAICDAAGALVHLRAAAGLVLPRSGGACPLWPLYRALTRPGQALRATVAVPGSRAAPLLCYAVAGPKDGPGFEPDPVIESVMLVLPAGPPAGEPLPVGPTCRLCPRDACPARREPSVLA